ncbi:unnamed protein product [Acidithrix sp. C25]|nr:unnamed protein product [Acidithrix sp. C25]
MNSKLCWSQLPTTLAFIETISKGHSMIDTNPRCDLSRICDLNGVTLIRSNPLEGEFQWSNN